MNKRGCSLCARFAFIATVAIAPVGLNSLAVAAQNIHPDKSAAVARPGYAPVTHANAMARAKAIIAKMTLDEKIAQLHGVRDPQNFRIVLGLERLGIPALRMTNGPAGVGPGGAGRQKPATAMPAPIALAATWDPELAHKYGQLEAQEARSLGSQLFEAPDINIARIPQGGRVFESFGEDPFLTSRIAVADIEGIQGEGILANVKHYLANNQEEERRTANEIIAERTMREIYLPGFEASIKEAHSASVMCAYPRVNGPYNCENAQTLTEILKKDWGFDGFVLSDWGATHSTVASALNGLDLEMPTGQYFGDELKKAIAAGQVPIDRINDMLARRLAKMIEFGEFAPQPKPKPIPAFEDGAISRDIAEQGIVLLKNTDNMLPLDRATTKGIALIGPWAVQPNTGGGGSSQVIPLYTITPYDGLRASVESMITRRITMLDGNDIDAAAAAAKSADVAIVMVGDQDREGVDQSVELPATQTRMIEAVAKANPNTVVVLKTGSAVVMPWIDSVRAVVEAWYPGEEDGNAVAAVLLGDSNPSGKLPLSFPQSVNDTLASNPQQYPGVGDEVKYSEGLEVGYRAYAAHKIQPLFPFGFGLSYTQFMMDGLKVSRGSGDSATVSFKVTNTGKRAGAEVAQLYLGFPPIAEGNEPPLQLKGFRKVMLNPGESKTVELKLDARSFSYWSEKSHGWQVPAGTFEVMVGNSSANTPLKATLQLH